MKCLVCCGGQFDVGLMVGLLVLVFVDCIVCCCGQEGCYQLVNGMGVMLDVDDVLGCYEWFIVLLLLQGSVLLDVCMLLVLLVEIGELIVVCFELVKSFDMVEWDEVQGMLKVWWWMVIGQLVIKIQLLVKFFEVELYQVMFNGICEKGFGVFNWMLEVEQLCLWLYCVVQWLLEEVWFVVDDVLLLVLLEIWLLLQMNGVYFLWMLKVLDLCQVLQDWLLWLLCQKLDCELLMYYIVLIGSCLVI